MTPIVINRLDAYEGPHIYAPAPGVLLRVVCDRDRSRRLRAALKDGAQFIGLLLANLTVEAMAHGEGQLSTALFSTDDPRLGAELCAYVVAGIAAEAAGDDEWDRDGPLFALQARRRAEAMPVAALQLVAEARRRGLPTFGGADGRVQLGYGARGWSFDATPLRERGALPPSPPWERLGSVPIVAVTGQTGRAAAVAAMAAELAAGGLAVRSHAGAGFDEARALLADPGAEALVLGLDTDELLRRGLPCERCELAVVTDRAGPRPQAADDDDAWVRALGLPMLLSPQAARLNLADPGLLPLVPYAPNGVVAL